MAVRVRFLLVLGMVCSCAAVAVAAAFGLGHGLLKRSPRVVAPRRLEHPALSLRYPGNWRVDRQAESHGALCIRPMLDDARIHVFFYDFPLSSPEAAEQVRDSLRTNFAIVASRPIDRWGRFEGRGFELDLRAAGRSYRARTFGTSRGSASFEVIEIGETEAQERLEPGFALVRDSFVFRPRKVVAALVSARSG